MHRWHIPVLGPHEPTQRSDKGARKLGNPEDNGAGRHRLGLRAKLLLPPLIMLQVVCILSSFVFGGSVWWWMLFGWIAAAPMTLLWGLLTTRQPRKTPGDTRSPLVSAEDTKFTSRHRADH